jgi:hypothetical protein
VQFPAIDGASVDGPASPTSGKSKMTKIYPRVYNGRTNSASKRCQQDDRRGGLNRPLTWRPKRISEKYAGSATDSRRIDEEASEDARLEGPITGARKKSDPERALGGS